MVTLAEQEFEVVTEIEATENDMVRRLDVSVFRETDPDEPLYSLSGFLGRY